MAKKESTLTNMIITLFLVTLCASALLGFVAESTKEPITEAVLAKKQFAIRKVLPKPYDNKPYEDQKKIGLSKGDSINVYPAYHDNELKGLAVEKYTKKGFSGLIKLMVGFNTDGTIHDIVVIQHAETPGLGDKITETKSDFNDQFNGKKPGDFELKVKKDGGDVDAITAATISSRAFCDAVKKADIIFKLFKKQK